MGSPQKPFSHTFLSTPSARRATCKHPHCYHPLIFLSTPSARRATLLSSSSTRAFTNFYPRPPRGGRPPLQWGRLSGQNFYPRPPRGGRQARRRTTPWPAYFYPRPPRGGRLLWRKLGFLRADFYPRPPRGGRPGWVWAWLRCAKFLSTPSARRATKVAPYVFLAVHISIHALREEGDNGKEDLVAVIVQFLSTPSARRATMMFSSLVSSR